MAQELKRTRLCRSSLTLQSDRRSIMPTNSQSHADSDDENTRLFDENTTPRSLRRVSPRFVSDHVIVTQRSLDGSRAAGPPQH
jgi:hypothetical protein